MFRDFDFWFDIVKIVFSIGLVILFVVSFFPFSREYEKKEIYSVESIVESDGTFFLGSGGIDSDPKYYAYEIEDDGSLTLHTYDASSVKLYMDVKDGDHPYALYKVMSAKAGTSSRSVVEIHIPPNSVVRNYDFSFK